MNRTLGNVLVVLVLGWFGSRAWSAEPPPQPRLPVVCSAIHLEDEPPPSGPDDFLPQPELIVLGKARPIDDGWEVDVEKVLYGSWKAGKVQFGSRLTLKGGLPGKDERGIFALVPRFAVSELEVKPFQLLMTFDAAEEKAVRAVAAARLDYNTLAAECLFVGKEVEARDASHRIVEVLKPLAGTPLRKGERICVYHRGAIEVVGGKPALRTEPEIYFIHHVDRQPKETVYSAACRLPADWETAVLAALKRRDEHPIIETKDAWQPRYREILFRGGSAEAVDLLGSWNAPAVQLAMGKLVHEHRSSKPLVITAIETGLVRTVEKEPGQHRQLRNLIRVLGEIQRREGKDADLRRLIERQIDHLASNPPEPPKRPQQSDSRPFRTFDEDSTDANHGLLWLLRQLDRNKVYKDFGPRLLRLREQVKGRWKSEVQLTLDTCDVEERLELDKVQQRFQGVKPAATAKEMRLGDRCVLAFSHNGQFLATADDTQVRVWKTSDWSQLSSWPLEASIRRVCFSPDDKLLYVAGGGQGPVHARYDWRTGKIERTYTVHKEGLCDLELSADGRRMASADSSGKVFHVCDTETGKILKSYRMQGWASGFTFSPDGRTLLRATEIPKNPAGMDGKDETEPGWVVETLEGKPLPLKDPSSKAAWLFSRAGRYLVSGEGQGPDARDDEPGLTLRVHDVRRELAEVASRHEKHFGRRFTISANDKRLVIVDRSGMIFTVLSLPDLKTIRTCKLPAAVHRTHKLSSVALSPDGKTLAVTVQYHYTPFLFDTDTGNRILPTRGHPGRIGNVFFPPDGKTLRSLDNQNVLCTWDAATLRLLGRVSFPDSFQVLSARPLDGKYLLCRDLAAPDNRVLLRAVDADTGGVMSSLTLPESYAVWQLKPLVLWLNASEVVLCADKNLARIDFWKGKLVKEIKAEKAFPWRNMGSAAPTVDGTECHVITNETEFGLLQGWSIDLLTGKVQDFQKKRIPRGDGDYFGEVPGHRYFFVGHPDLYLLDRKSLDVAVKKHFRDVDLLGLAFSGDGGRYAVVTSDRIPGDALRNRWRPGTQSLVRVYETSGKAVAAFPTSTRSAGCRLSPDGKRLVVINEDDTLEAWDLSAGKPGDGKSDR